MSDIPTTLTAGHRQLHRLLADHFGLEVEDEWPAGRFWIDCYSSEIHMGFEFDGEDFHASVGQRRRDAERDAEILEEHGVPIFRVTAEDLKVRSRADLIQRIETFMDQYGDDIRDRRLIHARTEAGA